MAIKQNFVDGIRITTVQLYKICSLYVCSLSVQVQYQKCNLWFYSLLGLCGACHTGVAKAIRTRLNEPGSENIKVVCIGDKSRAVLQRLYRNHIICVANEVTICEICAL